MEMSEREHYQHSTCCSLMTALAVDRELEEEAAQTAVILRGLGSTRKPFLNLLIVLNTFPSCFPEYSGQPM